MNEETRKKDPGPFVFFLIILGPIGFIYFLCLHVTKGKLLEEIEEAGEHKISRRDHGATVTIWAIICLSFLGIVSGIEYVEPGTSYEPSPDNGVPSYEIISIEDASIGKTVRTVVRVNYKAYTTRPGFHELVAKDVVKKITEKQEVNAIAVFFYRGPTAEHTYLGKVVWAPHGDWSEASNAVTGNYFWHKYSSD